MKAAVDLLARPSFSSRVTVGRIVSEAGVSRATFYHHFGSRQALVAELNKAGFQVSAGGALRRRKTILDAAVMLFSQQGLRATTMEQIAEAACITKGAIYWHFKDKYDLFQSVIKRTSPLLSLLPGLEGQIEEPPQYLLPLIANAYLATSDNPDGVRLFRILFSEAPRMPEVADNFGRMARPALDFLERYLELQIKKGRLRPHDTCVSSRVFIGALLQYMMAREFIPLLSIEPLNSKTYVEKLVGILIQGVGI
jgi:TetR/AcrR family transcriptional regulator, mexJK operon transcriptional repressor